MAASASASSYLWETLRDDLRIAVQWQRPVSHPWPGSLGSHLGLYALKLPSICPHIDPAKVASVAFRRRQWFFDPSSKPPRLVVIAECVRTTSPSAMFRLLL